MWDLINALCHKQSRKGYTRRKSTPSEMVGCNIHILLGSLMVLQINREFDLKRKLH